MSLIKNIKTNIILFILMFLPTAASFAQPKTNESLDEYNKMAGALLFLLVALMFIIFLVLASPRFKYTGKKVKKEATLFQKFRQKITQSVPLDKEDEILLDHDFDGIRELDNKVPPWFNVLFYGTIIFGIIYLVFYHVTGTGKLMADEYVDEIIAAQQQRDELVRTGAFVNENTVTLLTDAASLENGKTTFTNNCTPCHGPNGGGTVGPNLTDNYWIHGGGIKNLFKTIKYGVPAKGMISWQTQLNPKKIQEVASYVISLSGTNPPGGKPPEGTIWVDSTQTKAPGDSTKTITKKVDSMKVDVKTDTTKKGK